MGWVNDAEDIAQEVLLKFCEGRGQHQTIDQAVGDLIRGKYRVLGFSRNEHRRQRLRMVPVEDARGVAAPEAIGRDFENIIGSLQGLERVMVKLRYEWGFTAREIADCFGVTESRISQRLKGIQKGLSLEMALDEQRPDQVVRSKAELEAWREREKERLVSGLLPPATAGMECPEDREMAEGKFWEVEIDHGASFPEWFA